ncbi:MAG: hypothetical protein ABI461_01685 [Polyangiaceae bacterium]
MVDDPARPKAFPKPRRPSGSLYRSASIPLAQREHVEPAKRVVVTRADPPEDVDETDLADPSKKLSKDEIQAILAVNKINMKSGRTRTMERIAVATAPLGIGSVIAHAAFGAWGVAILIAGGLAWALVPMAKQDREGWSHAKDSDDDV